MKLVKPLTPTDDVRTRIEREVYYRHCQNIAEILSAAVDRNLNYRTILIDQYLDVTNAVTEE